MAGDTEAFLEELQARDREPLLEHLKGTMRLELSDGDRVDHIHLDVSDGRIVVGRTHDSEAHPVDEQTTPECIVRVPRELFDDFVTGRANAMTAFLRCEVEVEGDPVLLMRLGRLFPGPPDERSVVAADAGAR